MRVRHKCALVRLFIVILSYIYLRGHFPLRHRRKQATLTYYNEVVILRPKGKYWTLRNQDRQSHMGKKKVFQDFFSTADRRMPSFLHKKSQSRSIASLIEAGTSLIGPISGRRSHINKVDGTLESVSCSFDSHSIESRDYDSNEARYSSLDYRDVRSNSNDSDVLRRRELPRTTCNMTNNAQRLVSPTIKERYTSSNSPINQFTSQKKSTSPSNQKHSEVTTVKKLLEGIKPSYSFEKVSSYSFDRGWLTNLMPYIFKFFEWMFIFALIYYDFSIAHILLCFLIYAYQIHNSETTRKLALFGKISTHEFISKIDNESFPAWLKKPELISMLNELQLKELSGFEIKKVLLGTIPLKIGGCKVFPRGSKSENDGIMLEMELIYSGDAKVQFIVQRIAAEIKNINLRGTVRIYLKPLLNTFPLIGGGIGTFADLPGITENLVAKDINMVGKGSSDPYAIVVVNGKKVSFQSQYVEKNLNPIWDYECNFILDGDLIPEDHQCEILVYDYDQGTQDDFMGNAIINLQSVFNNLEFDHWVPLTNIKKGKVHLKMNFRECSPVLKPQGDYILHIFIESCSNLTSNNDQPVLSSIQCSVNNNDFILSQKGKTNPENGIHFINEGATFYTTITEELIITIMCLSCCCLGCRSGYLELKSRQNGPNSCIPKLKVSFHSFAKNDDLREKGIRAIHREGFVPSVCSRHFHESCFQLERNDKNVTRLKNNTSKGMRLAKLNPYAVPTIFPGRVEQENQRRIERCNFDLCVRLFHELTINALDHYASQNSSNECYQTTAEVMRILKRFWNGVNVCSTSTHVSKRDATLKHITYDERDQIIFLTSFSSYLEKVSRYDEKGMH
ncbi:unnamed protein product [Lepeophtheirus salmonis]|uniref:(salmon louse) hypothetical protein n=1 Tax=Lepeophtheirus salmonis TaxID=72036 RepID=A0A7R8CIE2_LEPSM|nr:unnamed protein product [Lepeophtheirus salmonis]CAF2831531.1 unnamed protein product [Lepeophtheirus salmonis]